MVDMLAAEGHIDYWIANRLEVADGCLTGKVLGEIVSKTVKLHALQTWADRLGIPMSQTVAVGDGANDIPMIQAAGLGLAFCAKPKDPARRRQSHQRPRPNPRTRLPAPGKILPTSAPALIVEP